MEGPTPAILKLRNADRLLGSAWPKALAAVAVCSGIGVVRPWRLPSAPGLVLRGVRASCVRALQPRWAVPASAEDAAKRRARPRSGLRRSEARRHAESENPRQRHHRWYERAHEERLRVHDAAQEPRPAGHARAKNRR